MRPKAHVREFQGAANRSSTSDEGAVNSPTAMGGQCTAAEEKPDPQRGEDRQPALGNGLPALGVIAHDLMDLPRVDLSHMMREFCLRWGHALPIEDLGDDRLCVSQAGQRRHRGEVDIRNPNVINDIGALDDARVVGNLGGEPDGIEVLAKGA